MNLITTLKDYSPVLVMLFWMGATAALFSTADMQVYSAILVVRFNTKTGETDNFSFEKKSIFLYAAAIYLIFAVIYVVTRKLELGEEKIIFVVVPFCTVLAPAFLHFAFGREVRAWVLLCSLVGYIIVAAIGFAMPSQNFVATLSAVLAPLTVALITLPFLKKRGENSGFRRSTWRVGIRCHFSYQLFSRTSFSYTNNSGSFYFCNTSTFEKEGALVTLHPIQSNQTGKRQGPRLSFIFGRREYEKNNSDWVLFHYFANYFALHGLASCSNFYDRTRSERNK